MKLTRCVQCVITVSAVAFVSDSFNVDVKTAVVNQGQKGTAFGYTAEFIQGGSGGHKVTIQRDIVTSVLPSRPSQVCVFLIDHPL